MSGRAEKSFVPSAALSPEEAARFLRPFGAGVPEETETLLSYTWEDGYFRRIVRCRFGAGDLVLKVRREEDVSLARLSSQCAFSEYLAEHGIPRERLEAIISSNEYALRQRDYGTADGVILACEALSTWLYSVLSPSQLRSVTA